MAGSAQVTTDRLSGLLDAVVAMSSDLSLDGLLERIVRVACEAVGARYGFLGVLERRSDRRLGRYATYGVPANMHQTIGRLPDYDGLLGYLIEHPEPLRIDDIATHPARVGFPAAHPGMTSFLGVPIRVQERVFGNIYLTNKIDADAFTHDDEQIAVALASAAGVAIENARLYEQGERQRRWLEAAADITAALLGHISLSRALQLVADRARDVAQADFVALLMPEPDGHLRVEAVSGGDPLGVVGELVDADNSVAGDVARTRVTAVVPDTEREPRYQTNKTPGWPDLGSVLVIPLRRGEHTGALVIGWHKGHQTQRWELDPDLPQRFADQAALVLQVAQAQEDQALLAVFEDRDRIGRDLHDLVIQRLFAIGLMLDNTTKLVTDDDGLARLSGAIDEIDATIKDIRRAIFELGASPTSGDLRQELDTIVGNAGSLLGFRPGLQLRGPVDSVVTDAVRVHLVAVLGEALSNAVRHAQAQRVDVSLDVTDEVRLVVRDDGKGLSGGPRESGLRNMRDRAALLGGTLEVRSERGQGVEICWTVPRSTP